jgi:hypothetical protein
VQQDASLTKSDDDGKCVAATTSEDMVIGTVQALCALSLLVSQQDYSDIFPQALTNTLKQFYKNKRLSKN